MKRNLFRLIFLLFFSITFADQTDFSTVPVKKHRLSNTTLGEVTVQLKLAYLMHETYEAQLKVSWNKQTKPQLLYEGMCGEITSITGKNNSIIVSSRGNRYDYETYRYHMRYTYNTHKNSFIEDSTWSTEEWTPYIAKVKRLLANGSLDKARKLVQDKGTSPNYGHTEQDSLFTFLFLKDAHDRALKAWRKGQKKQAVQICHDFFYNTPQLDFNTYSAGFSKEFYLLQILQSKKSYNKVQPTAKATEIINNIAFFMQDSEHAWLSVELLKQVLHFAPNRTAAYLNLGDAYATLGMRPKAERNYQAYIKRMTEQGKAHKIPKRIQAFKK